MPFYSDWIIALDDVARGKPGAEITARNARDIIAELGRLKAQVKALATPEADRSSAEDMAVLGARLDQLAR